jgi:hypothetical protein
MHPGVSHQIPIVMMHSGQHWVHEQVANSPMAISRSVVLYTSTALVQYFSFCRSQKLYQISESLGDKHTNPVTNKTYLTGQKNIYELCNTLCKAVTGSKLVVTLEMMGWVSVLVCHVVSISNNSPHHQIVKHSYHTQWTSRLLGCSQQGAWNAAELMPGFYCN